MAEIPYTRREAAGGDRGPSQEKASEKQAGRLSDVQTVEEERSQRRLKVSDLARAQGADI